MSIGGSLWRWLSVLGGTLYRYLCVCCYWLLKHTDTVTVRFKRRLIRAKQGKTLAALGREIYRLHQQGRTDWPEDSQIKTLLERADANSQKAAKLEARFQAADDHYRQRVEKLKKGKTQEAAETAEAEEAQEKQQQNDQSRQ
ncbi:MAG: hypothetical protein JRJ12_10565 [Deltaproteobacteria bacterium]|nr:hypothetical protein [Deltaproteobacteria bacterium]MBW2071922.1 hypothetical protein [Deltaproteobacteria bacterium]